MLQTTKVTGKLAGFNERAILESGRGGESSQRLKESVRCLLVLVELLGREGTDVGMHTILLI